MKKLLCCSLVCCMLCGCINNIQVNTVKSWEGHYFTTNEFYNATKDIKLNENETIWVLSDKTLNNVLKNLRK